MPRLFTGLEIPGDVAERLIMLRGDIVTARWIAPENYHITLRFLGDVSRAIADEYVSRIEQISVDPFSLVVRGVGHFGTKRANALWARIEPSDQLTALHQAHERAAIAVGLKPETRKFTPHITLARLSRTRPQTIAPFLSNFADFQSAPFEINHAVLYSAKPSTGGGPYVVEEVLPFIQNHQDELPSG